MGSFVIGIDEAGYSPLMGPLVISTAAFEVERIPADWWCELGIPRAGQTAGALPFVDDSKKLYKPSEGPARLETAVLAFLHAAGHQPQTLRQLLKCVYARAATEQYPWYAGEDVPLPIAADPAEIAKAAEALRQTFDKTGIRFTALRSIPMLVGDYNNRLLAQSNKSLVLCQATLELVAADLRPGQPLTVFADKQGGRNFYGDQLSQYFFGASIEPLQEGKAISTYSVRHASSEFEISFCLGGDAMHLPIALASMCSKYIRELFMELFNAYWAKLLPGVRRTSGYRTDGWKFLDAIGGLTEFRAVPQALIVRGK